ncbi:hypothetical protein ACFP7A_12690 [Sporolactobacillus kofuensis]|uniref:Uncharacterized protein n=1 Tax=Sporolactobacillus kofuensis TaxID=269672 RepID=A0ABW1WGH1_9BACL|nr:hypothetical protein [Sporolactobacillus kofuensis]MCO7176906.1 hypothetical protein [Sporolactobacillus kofuensis]
MKKPAGYIIGVLLLCLSLVIYNTQSVNHLFAIGLLIVSLTIIGMTELTVKLEKK